MGAGGGGEEEGGNGSKVKCWETEKYGDESKSE